MPDIFGDDLSNQVFFEGTEQMLGPSLCSRKKSEYPRWNSVNRLSYSLCLPYNLVK